LRTGAELGFLCGAMRAPGRAIKCGARMRNTLRKRIILMRWWWKPLPVDKNGEPGADGKHHNNGDAYLS